MTERVIVSLDSLVKFYKVVRMVEGIGGDVISFSFRAGHGNPVITEIVIGNQRFDTQAGKLYGSGGPPTGLIYALEEFMHRMVKDHNRGLGFRERMELYAAPDGWVMVSAEKNSWELNFHGLNKHRYTGVVSEESFTQFLSRSDKSDRLLGIKILPKILPLWREREALRKAKGVSI